MKVLFWVLHHVVVKCSDISEKHTASIHPDSGGDMSTFLNYSDNLPAFTVSNMKTEVVLFSDKVVTTCIPDSTVSQLRRLEADK